MPDPLIHIDSPSPKSSTPTSSKPTPSPASTSPSPAASTSPCPDPSGCGKSTLLSILGLLDTPTGGTYTLNDKPVANLNFAERSRIRNQEIGFIFQSFNLIGDLSVFENVELPLTYRPGMAAAEKRKTRVTERARARRHGPPYEATSLPSSPEASSSASPSPEPSPASPSILLADEPTGNLDSKNGEAVMKLLAELHAEGSTICMVTHDNRFAAHAQRQIHLFDGKVVAEGELAQLLADPAHNPSTTSTGASA